AIRAAQLALAYRQEFGKDVVVDVFCYRRHGHNEADEPSYTQPLLYKKIHDHPSVLQLYSERLGGDGVLRAEAVGPMRAESQRENEAAFEESRRGEHHFEPDIPLAVSEEELQEFQPTGGTSVSDEVLTAVARALSEIPEGFRLHPKLQALIARRRELVAGDG